MIFLLPEGFPALFVMLAEKDVKSMREGHTCTVAAAQLQGRSFNQLVLSLHATNEAARQVLVGGGYKVDGSVFTKPDEPHLTPCNRCRGNKEPQELFEGRCIICWAATAKAVPPDPPPPVAKPDLELCPVCRQVVGNMACQHCNGLTG